MKMVKTEFLNVRRIGSLILIFNIIAFIYYICFYKSNGYLPTPFFFDTSDSFMDFFNTMFWSLNGDPYGEWHSIYPPLVFLLLRFVGAIFTSVSYINPNSLRDCSTLIYLITFFYFLIPILVLRTKDWDGFVFLDKVIIYFASVLSIAMLFAYERGNLILIAPLFLALLFSNRGYLRFLSFAILVNLKPYFFLLILLDFFKKDWKSLFITIFSVSALFFITGFLLGGNFLVFFKNIVSFSASTSGFSLREIFAFPSSISVFSYALLSDAGVAFSQKYLGVTLPKTAPYIIEIIKWTFLIFSLILVGFKQKIIKEKEIYAFLVVFISNLGIWVGGYTMILFFVLIPTFTNMKYKYFYISCLTVLILPIDLIAIKKDYLGVQYSFLSDSQVLYTWKMGLGSILRPIINISLLGLMTHEFFGRRELT